MKLPDVYRKQLFVVRDFLESEHANQFIRQVFGGSHLFNTSTSDFGISEKTEDLVLNFLKRIIPYSFDHLMEVDEQVVYIKEKTLDFIKDTLYFSDFKMSLWTGKNEKIGITPCGNFLEEYQITKHNEQ